MHLPVARECNIQCNYCVRKYDCANESRPGVTTRVLSPSEAFNRFMEVKSNLSNLTVVGIAGPGDALANFPATSKTLRMIRMADPDVTFCLSTNGLMLPRYAEELADLSVSHVTVTVNAVDVGIASRIYKYVRYMGETYTGEAAAAILLSNQLEGIQLLVERGVAVKVNIVMMKDINDRHIVQVVERVKPLGVMMTNIMQLIPVKGSAFEHMPLVSNKEIMGMRESCGQILRQMMHCRQCRADAVGTLDDSPKGGERLERCCAEAEQIKMQAESKKPEKRLLAVTSHDGTNVDRHFGHAAAFYIFAYEQGTSKLLERRIVDKYCDGAMECEDENAAGSKMARLLNTIKDCACVITMRIGEAPRKMLEEKGIMVWTSFGPVEDAVAEAVCECGLDENVNVAARKA